MVAYIQASIPADDVHTRISPLAAAMSCMLLTPILLHQRSHYSLADQLMWTSNSSVLNLHHLVCHNDPSLGKGCRYQQRQRQNG